VSLVRCFVSHAAVVPSRDALPCVACARCRS
jgi:hypothetical protein